MIEMNHQVLVVSGWTDGGFKDKHIKDVVKALNPAEPGIGYKIKCTSCGRPTFTDTGLCLKCESKAGPIERGEK